MKQAYLFSLFANTLIFFYNCNTVPKNSVRAKFKFKLSHLFLYHFSSISYR